MIGSPVSVLKKFRRWEHTRRLFLFVVFFSCTSFIYIYHSSLWRNKAILHPERFITIAMDGSDQLSNGVPQFREASKDDSGQSRIKNRLEIVQVAGAPDIINCFVVPEDVANDTDVSVEVLQRTLKMEEKRRGGKLPPILNLQLDNCADKILIFSPIWPGFLNAMSFLSSTCPSSPWATLTTGPIVSRAVSPMQFAEWTSNQWRGSSS